MMREKIETFVDCPINGLDLSKFCFQNKNKNITTTTGNENLMYDLFAVCNHYGRMGFGHYSAFARDWKGKNLSDTWYSFDDDVVEKCTDDEKIVTSAAYILFYRRRPN